MMDSHNRVRAVSVFILTEQGETLRYNFGDPESGRTIPLVMGVESDYDEAFHSDYGSAPAGRYLTSRKTKIEIG